MAKWNWIFTDTYLVDLRKANQFAWWIGGEEKSKGKRKKKCANEPVLTISTKESGAVFKTDDRSLFIGSSMEGKGDYHFNVVYAQEIFDACQYGKPRIYLYSDYRSSRMLVTDGEHCRHVLMGMRV